MRNRRFQIVDLIGAARKLVLGLAAVGALTMVLAVHAQEGSKAVKEGVLEAMANPTKVILFSLNPDERREGGELTNGMILHGYRELGETALDETQTRRALAAVMPSITGWEDRGDRCNFEPRHALRIVSARQTYDILLCYHCGDLAVFEGGDEVAYRPLLGKADVLDDLLKETKVPAVKRPSSLPVKVEEVMSMADSAVVYALGPLDPAATNHALLHGFPILRQRALDKDDARQVGLTMMFALAAWDGIFLNCEFRPTRGARFFGKEGTFDLLFGYDCKQVVAYQGDKEVAYPGLGVEPSMPSLPKMFESYLTNAPGGSSSAGSGR